MKKTILFLICIFGVMSICSKCEVEDMTGRYCAKNNTDQDVILRLHFDQINGPHMSENNVKSGETFLFWECYSFIKQGINFDRWFQGMLGYGNYIKLQVLSADGVLLQEWNYMDKDLPGKQFFSEPSWQYDETTDSHGNLLVTWMFDILPEDIAQPEP